MKGGRSANDEQAVAEGAGLTAGQVLGEVAWLMSQSPPHRSIPLGALTWLVLPAIQLNQFKLHRVGNKPWGYISWAFLVASIVDRLKNGNLQLAPGEWKSGPELFLVDLVAPFGGAQELIGEVAKNFPDLPLKSVARNAEGIMRLGEFVPKQP